MVDGCFLTTQLRLDWRAVNSSVLLYSTDIIQQVSTLIAMKMGIQYSGINDVDIAMVVGLLEMI